MKCVVAVVVVVLALFVVPSLSDVTTLFLSTSYNFDDAKSHIEGVGVSESLEIILSESLPGPRFTISPLAGSLTIRSSNPNVPVVIFPCVDLGASLPYFQIGSKNVLFEGVGIYNVTLSTSGYRWPVIYMVSENSALRFNKCSFRYNSGPAYLVSNKAAQEGSAYSPSNFNNQSVTFTDCLFSDNTFPYNEEDMYDSAAVFFGSAATTSSCSLVVTDCQVFDNIGYVFFAYRFSVDIRESVFLQNELGPPVRGYLGPSTRFYIEACSFVENSCAEADPESETGGAVYVEYGSMTVNMSTFLENVCSNGGAIGGIPSSAGLLDIAFVGNRGDHEGAAAYLFSSAGLPISYNRCLFTRNVGDSCLLYTGSQYYTYFLTNVIANNTSLMGVCVEGSSFFSNNIVCESGSYADVTCGTPLVVPINIECGYLRNCCGSGLRAANATLENDFVCVPSDDGGYWDSESAQGTWTFSDEGFSSEPSGTEASSSSSSSSSSSLSSLGDTASASGTASENGSTSDNPSQTSGPQSSSESSFSESDFVITPPPSGGDNIGGGGGGKGALVAALIIVPLMLLVGLGAGYVVWSRRQKKGGDGEATSPRDSTPIALTELGSASKGQPSADNAKGDLSSGTGFTTHVLGSPSEPTARLPPGPVQSEASSSGYTTHVLGSPSDPTARLPPGPAEPVEGAPAPRPRGASTANSSGYTTHVLGSPSDPTARLPPGPEPVEGAPAPRPRGASAANSLPPLPPPSSLLPSSSASVDYMTHVTGSRTTVDTAAESPRSMSGSAAPSRPGSALRSPSLSGAQARPGGSAVPSLVIQGMTAPVVLGAGGQATVYSAFSYSLGFQVCIKVFHKTADYERESQVLAKVPPHPNIIEILAVSNAPQNSLVCRLATRGSLTDVMSGGSLSPRDITTIAKDVATGLHHLHGAGVCHLDIKPANILITSSDLGDYQAIITDFGASFVQGRDDLRVDMCTVKYAAPEVLAMMGGKSITEAGLASYTGLDVYSFGVTLWEMATGKSPHEQLNAAGIVAAGLADPLGFRVNSFLIMDKEIGSIVERCTRTAESRPSSLREILGWLTRLGDGGSESFALVTAVN